MLPTCSVTEPSLLILSPPESFEVATVLTDRPPAVLLDRIEPFLEGRVVGRTEAGIVPIEPVQTESLVLGRNGTGQISVAGDLKGRQVAEVAEFGRDRAGQIVVAERERPQVGEVSQLRRDRPGELVVAEREPGQAGEVAQFRRDLAREIVRVEREQAAQHRVRSGHRPATRRRGRDRGPRVRPLATGRRGAVPGRCRGLDRRDADRRPMAIPLHARPLC